MPHYKVWYSEYIEADSPEEAIGIADGHPFELENYKVREELDIEELGLGRRAKLYFAIFDAQGISRGLTTFVAYENGISEIEENTLIGLAEDNIVKEMNIPRRSITILATGKLDNIEHCNYLGRKFKITARRIA